jgi:hypothetical protein
MAPGGDGRFWRIWSSAQDRTPAPDPEPRPEPAAGAQEEQEQPGDPEPSSAPEMGDAAPAETEAAE